MKTPALKLMRLRQLPKNLLVFAAPMAAYRYNDLQVMSDALLLFVAFAALSCGVYALNDVADAESDRHHPIKRHRPVAAGEITPRHATIIGLTLLLIGVGLTFPLAGHTTLIVLLYIVLNLWYSAQLKNVPIVELMIVASGFVMRVVVGLLITPGPRTPEFMLVVFFGSILVVASKRLSEQISSSSARRVLASYSPDFLKLLLAVSATAFLLSYITFAFGQVGPRWEFSDLGIGLTVVPLFYVVAEFIREAMGGTAGEPEYVFVRNRRIFAAVVAFALFYSSGLWFR